MSCPAHFPKPRCCFQNALLLICVFSLFPCSTAAADDPVDWSSFGFTPISVMQGVNTSGGATWAVPKPNGTNPAYKLRGAVLNDPAMMLDGTADSSAGPSMYMGGQWQIYVQAIDRPDTPAELVGDSGGVCLWMGQNYGNHSYMYGSDYANQPIYSYNDEDWCDELDRLNYAIDISTGVAVADVLRPGDLIEIHARGGMHYNGKFNCNEQHKKSAGYDFDIYIVERNVALPITDFELSDVKTDADAFRFDAELPTREFGGEYYQGERVRLQNVTITNPEQWGLIDPTTISLGTNDTGDYYTIKVADVASDRTFDVKLGQNDSFAGTSAPSGPLDIVGIFDQEGAVTGGYRMWALAPDAFLNADLLPGDADMNGTVNDVDAVIMATNWGKLNNAVWRQGDFNCDGQVNQADAAMMAENWLQSSASNASSAAAPEPGMLVLLTGCSLMFWVLRKRDCKR